MMKKKLLLMILAVTLSASMSITAFAAPATMQDGNIFDAEYYALNNPDVVAILGYNDNALYSHYINYGQYEGRLPYDEVVVAGLASDDGFVRSIYDGGYHDDIVALDVSDPVYRVFESYNSYGYMETPVSKINTTEMLHYFEVAANNTDTASALYYVDYDAMDWLAEADIDANLKYNYLNMIHTTDTKTSIWLINSPEISTDLKVQYFRTHKLQDNEKCVMDWWYNNIGSKLTMEQTSITDSDNYDLYMRTATGKIFSTLLVHVGDKKYLMSSQDVEAAVNAGKIRKVPYTYYTMGVTGTSYEYFANSTNIGYRMWNYN